MTPSSIVENESSIIERLILSPGSAEALLSVKISDCDEQRMQELMEKNNKGTITEDERTEMESYRRFGNFLAIVQAKARELLQDRDSQELR
jgi:hypothetical protein